MANRYIGDPGFGLNENNPFLEMLRNVDNNIQPDPFNFNPYINEFVPRQQQFQQQGRTGSQKFSFKLPEFWPHAPAMWFARAEFRFEVANIDTEREKFMFTVDALPYESLRLVNDLMMAPPENRPYAELKERLLLATQLTPVQMADKLMRMPDLGDRRPSQLLAQLMEFCPPGEEGTAFFRAAYLTRLPADIRGHLDGLETGSLKDLAARADRQWANMRSSAAMMAHVDGQELETDEDGDMIAAVKQDGRKWLHKKKETSGAVGTAAKGAGGQGSTAKGEKRGWDRMVQLTLCRRHMKFGEAAYSCADPANCQYKKLGN